MSRYYSSSESEDELDESFVSLLTTAALFAVVLAARFFLGL
jgi:hypothetical protein